MEELKSCPFCGNKDIKIEWTERKNFSGYIVWCWRCDVEQLHLCDDHLPEFREEAIKKWKSYQGKIQMNQIDVIVNHQNVEDIFWNYAIKNPEILPVFQLSLFHGGITNDAFDLTAFEKYVRSNGYLIGYLRVYKAFSYHLLRQICVKND
jgi:hypothetical protein